MKKVLFIGKMNDTVKDINAYLQQYFQVQLTVEDTEMAMGMLKVVEPDIILISLIGLYDVDSTLMQRISVEYPKIPVLTIGAENEQQRFSRYYAGEQFENLLRPLDNDKVLEAISRRLDLKEDELRTLDEEKGGKPLVLIVDDNAATLRSIKAMLDEPYNTAVATSGIKAMTAMGKKRPDLILLDYEMPVCDGRQTLEMIRADDELKDIPVIFLTGVDDREHIEAVLKLRPAGYLLKPAVRDKLIEAIDKALKKQ